MAAPATVDDFLAVVAKSGLLDQSTIAAFRAKIGGTGSPPATPKEMALAMIRDGVLTSFQA
jgi:hypothetical protein